jgi:prolipoprotein diacylglyceryltransferase
MIIPKINFPIYGIIIVLSVLIGLIYIAYHLKKDGYTNNQLILYFVMYAMCAFVFGKMYTVFAYGDKDFLSAGLSSYGGLFGVVIASVIFDKIIKVKSSLVEYSILSLPLIYGLTKIACSIVGCCSGIPYEGIFKIKYLGEMNIWQFPVQITEVIVFIILFLVVNHFKDKKYINYITLMLVSLFKFALDFLRYDHVKELITKNQIFSIFIIVIAIVLFIIEYKKKTRIL